ncbi:branched-chain amino acid ABC transporter permease [Leptolyngbya sp. 'hensonii']|uniref:branched-chain amino acid ABC transporter permease n=1 Tax=Leptolyngbya sp. 'hensonii' TaxID=1922337 RepID=UPI00094FB63F|nr:branched-chain amino acid ABC transporter permease [Leptolyngbya sp. 'hensonii']OLP16595.1 branched-chain amino acid ABC transporter permease [Leptolyngbya sp. 'hensonii']
MTGFFTNYGFLIVSMLFGAMLALSLYLPLMAGQLSLASPGFYALGGYIAAILSTQVFPATGAIYPLHLLLLEMGIAGIISGGLGLLVGVLVLRLRGIYLAIATIAFVEILRVLSLNLEMQDPVRLLFFDFKISTGGAVGIFGIPQPFTTPIEYLWIAVPMLAISMALIYRLEKIRAGRALIAIREDELAADAMGINTTAYKVMAFTLGAVLAGMVGAVSAHFLNTWNARQGTFEASIDYLASVLIGGSRIYLGPVLGGMVFRALPEVLRITADIRLIVFGLLIVLGTLFFPQGLVTPGLLQRLQWRRK